MAWRFLLSGLFALSVTAFLAPASLAQTSDAGVDSPLILIVADDSDPTSVVRSSEIHREVQAAVAAVLVDQGVRVTTMSHVVAQVGWVEHDRAPNSEAIEMADMVCEAGGDQLCASHLLLITMRAAANARSVATVLQVRTNADVYDRERNRMFYSTVLADRRFSAPRDCASQCLEWAILERAPSIGAALGEDIAARFWDYPPAEFQR